MSFFSSSWVWATDLQERRRAVLLRFGTSDPLRQGWKYHGDRSLFSWESVAGRMAVTWDSSHSNSYFYLPLMTVLGRTDSFELGFDLETIEHVLGNRCTFSLCDESEMMTQFNGIEPGSSSRKPDVATAMPTVRVN